MSTTCSAHNFPLVKGVLGADMAIDYNSEPFDLAFSDASRGVGVGIDKGKGKGKGKGKRVNMDGSCNVPPPDTILDLVGGATEQRSLRLLPPTSGIYLNVLNSGFQTMFRDAGYGRLAHPCQCSQWWAKLLCTPLPYSTSVGPDISLP